MAGTLAEAQAQRDEALAAITAVTTQGQSYAIAGRLYTRAELTQLIELLKFWNAEVDKLTAAEIYGGIRGRGAVLA